MQILSPIEVLRPPIIVSHSHFTYHFLFLIRDHEKSREGSFRAWSPHHVSNQKHVELLSPIFRWIPSLNQLRLSFPSLRWYSLALQMSFHQCDAFAKPLPPFKFKELIATSSYFALITCSNNSSLFYKIFHFHFPRRIWLIQSDLLIPSPPTILGRHICFQIA